MHDFEREQTQEERKGVKLGNAQLEEYHKLYELGDDGIFFF